MKQYLDQPNHRIIICFLMDPQSNRMRGLYSVSMARGRNNKTRIAKMMQDPKLQLIGKKEVKVESISVGPNNLGSCSVGLP